VSGSNRCIKHCGPHAARAFRDRQLDDLRRGKITPAEFAAHEARRVANRLRDNWKKNPWLAGSTMDLGEHEWTFQEETGLAHRREPLPPAVLDWLRWKFRRLQIDRKQDEAWSRVLHQELPVRVRDAGPPTDEDLTALEQHSAAAVLWTVGEPDGCSKRQNLDRPTMKQPKPAAKLPRVPKVGAGEPDPGRIAAVCAEHHVLLNRLFWNCRSEAEKQSVMRALYAYVTEPDNAVHMRRWLDTVRLLSDGTRLSA
jgi:hypothetical protein